MYLFLLFSFTLFLSFGSDKKSTSPNVILILADDLGFADVGFNGYTDIPTTPNIDKIAEAGVIFTNDPEMGLSLIEATNIDVLGRADYNL